MSETRMRKLLLDAIAIQRAERRAILKYLRSQPSESVQQAAKDIEEGKHVE